MPVYKYVEEKEVKSKVIWIRADLGIISTQIPNLNGQIHHLFLFSCIYSFIF